MKYVYVKAGRDNLALTVFVPWDCTKNCSFCTTKQLYKKKIATIGEIEEKMKKLLKGFPMIKEVVISGGEPFNNLHDLWRLVLNIDRKYNIYVNTSFPKIKEEDKYYFEKVVERIKGINVSRHLNHDYSAFSSYEDMMNLCPYLPDIRINILLNKHIDPDNLEESKDIIKHIEHIKRYKFFDIQLRANYLKTSFVYNMLGTPFYLDEYMDETSYYINSLGRNFTRSGCEVCRTVSVEYSKNLYISFHKGLKNTLLLEKDDNGKDIFIVNDVILTPTAEVKLDWDAKPIDTKYLLESTYMKPKDPYYNKDIYICGRRVNMC